MTITLSKISLISMRATILVLVSLFYFLQSASLLASGSGGDAPPISSDKGYTTNGVITSVTGLEIDTSRLNLMYNLPITPTYNSGVQYGVSTRYSSNIFKYMAGYGQGVQIPIIPTLHSPFGVGYEYGNGVIYLDVRGDDDGFGDGNITDFRKSWVYISPDGASHQLEMMNMAWTPDRTHYDSVSGLLVGGEPLGAHLRGDTYISSTDGTHWAEYLNENADFVTSDNSLIKAKYHAPLSGFPAWWELLFPDGRRIEFRKQNAPPQKSLQESYFQNCGNVNLNTFKPAEMIGYYPTRVVNSTGVGYSLKYDATFPWILSSISDDTDRRILAGSGADINFLYTVIGGEPRYTSISYPGPNGAPLTVTLNYSTASASYRKPGGLASSGPFPGIDPASFTTLQITRLDSVLFPTG